MFNNTELQDICLPLFQYIDVIVDGPFQASKKDLNLPYRGSSNQRIIDAKKSYVGHIIELEIK